MEKPSRRIWEKVTDPLRALTVEPYMFFIAFAISLRMVPFQSLLMDRACRNTFGYSDEICDHMDEHKVAQERSIAVGNNLLTGIMLLSSIPAVIVVIFIGPWSDKYSRKLPLMLAVTGMFLETLIAVFLTLNKSISPLWFMFPSLCSGATGGFLVAMSSASSYLSDVSDERSRSTRFAIMDFFSLSATIFGNLLGGQLFKAYGYLVVISLTPCLLFCAFLYGLLVLKETKPPVPANKRCEMIKDLITLDNIKQSYRTCTRKRHGNIRLQIWLLVIVDTCIKFVGLGSMGIAFSYAKQMYKMNVTEFSNVNTVFSVINSLVTVTVIPLLTKKWMLHETAVGLIGTFSLMSKMVLSAVAYTLPVFYFAMISGTLFNCANIAVQSRLSKIVGKEELGRAFSLLGIFTSFAPMLGTTVFFQVYNASLATFPGLTYAAANILLLPSALIFWWMMRLPTISIGEFGREEETKSARPLETISSNYNRLDEEKF